MASTIPFSWYVVSSVKCTCPSFTISLVFFPEQYRSSMAVLWSTNPSAETKSYGVTKNHLQKAVLLKIHFLFHTPPEYPNNYFTFYKKGHFAQYFCQRKFPKVNKSLFVCHRNVSTSWTEKVIVGRFGLDSKEEKTRKSGH